MIEINILQRNDLNMPFIEYDTSCRTCYWHIFTVSFYDVRTFKCARNGEPILKSDKHAVNSIPKNQSLLMHRHIRFK